MQKTKKIKKNRVNNTVKFKDLSLSQETLKAIDQMGYIQAYPIQAKTIPLILQGKDVIGLAMTGTGKTASFGLPLIEKVDPNNRRVQALIVCPTRELAIQVSGELSKFLKYKRNISVLPVYGGQPIEGQIRALKKGVQIIVGTPGRLMDHIDRKTINLGSISMVVLDEADEMLNMGFRQDIEKILQKTPASRQTITFSATMPPAILILVKKYQKNPELIKVSDENAAATTVEQHYFEIESHKKLSLLKALLSQHNPYLAIVFCNTKYRVDDVVRKLRQNGFNAEGLHGDINQSKRTRIMNKFRSGNVQVLVATDVAARGIDVPNIDIIINYEIPNDEKLYVHRVGRTGRAGKTGLALNFVAKRDIPAFRNINRCIDVDMIRQQLPVLNGHSEQTKKPEANNVHGQQKLVLKIQKALDHNNIDDHIKTVEALVTDRHTPIKIAAALVSLLSKEKRDTFKKSRDLPRRHRR